MNRLDWYLGKTVAQMTILASAGLIALFVIFTFLDQMEDIQNDYTLITVLKYVGYSTPRMFYETLPYAVLIGCLTGLGLLANNSELIVMRTAGISTMKIVWAALKPTLIFVLIGLLVGELVLPQFERTARVIRENAMEDDITPQGGFWYREGNTYMHFDAVSHDGRLRNINQRILDPDGTLTQTLWAGEARYHYDVNPYWLLNNVVVTHLPQDGLNTGLSREHYESVKWRTRLTPELLNTEILVDPDKMSILELRRKISYMSSQGLNTGKFELGFWLKALQPLASFSLVIIAVSFIFGPLRETTMGMRVVSGLVIGITFKFVQNILSPASLVYGFHPLIATLVPILLCLAIGMHLIRKAN